MKSFSSSFLISSFEGEGQSILKLEERISHLEKVNRFAIEALDIAVSLTDLQPDINKPQEPAAILRDACSRIKRLIPFHAQAFFLIGEEDSEFHLAYSDPEHMKAFLQEEVDTLIDHGTFGWAVGENRPVIVSSRNSSRQLILHVLSTNSKISGMFIGVIDHSKGEIPDVSLSLLTIILLNCGNVVESSQLCRTIRDINKGLEQMVRERTKQLEYHALHDPLTDLPNRSLIFDRIEFEIRASKRRSKKMALLLIDLDGFKHVNDTLGHQAGDKLLIEFGDRLRRVVRKPDTIARLGGDEFAVFLPEIREEAAAMEVAQRILRCLGEPFALEQWLIHVDASIGIALFPLHGEDKDTIFRKADMAMYAAKRSKSGHAVYDTLHGDGNIAQLTLLGDLRRALDGDDLTLHFQPKVEIETGRICGVEALLRWHHPDKGYIPPNVFIPLVEQSGLIKLLTVKVVRMALHQERLWLEAGLDLPVAVNLSAMNLQELDLPDNVGAMLKEFNVPPGQLELEITESAIMTAPNRSLKVIEGLNGMGIRLAIDDFGTGYSSLAYLKRLLVQSIKIDRSFVENIHQDERDAKIVGSIIDLAHNLGLQVIAEGVEKRETWDRLSSLGCNMVQGYLISPPLPADELLIWWNSCSFPAHRPAVWLPEQSLNSAKKWENIISDGPQWIMDNLYVS
jgi:diguanylate cyclase